MPDRFEISVALLRCERSLPTVIRLMLTVVVAIVAAANPIHAAPPKGDLAANVSWRFDGTGRFPVTSAPIEWGQDSNVQWRTSIDAGGYSSPIIAANRIFVTAEMGSLFCLDLADGRVLWKKDLFGVDSPDIPGELSPRLKRGCGGDSKQSTPTPTSNGQLVFSINAMGLAACYDLSGNQKWIQILETAGDEEYFSSSPVFCGDRIILTWGCLLALDAATGKVLWKAEDALPTHGTPLVTRLREIDVVITPGGSIVRLADGEVLCSGLFESTFTTPTVVGDVLYVIDGKPTAFQLPEKIEKGMALKKLWSGKLKGAFMASPAFHDGLIYTIESQKSRVHILDAKTGAEVTARNNEASSPTETGAAVEGLTRVQFTYASPVATEQGIYFFDDSGNTIVVEPGRELRVKQVNKLPGGIVGTPFFVSDKIVFRTNDTVTCVGK